MNEHNTFLEKIFRSNPWMFVLLFVLVFSIGILIIVISFSGFRETGFYNLYPVDKGSVEMIETPEEKSDRLAIMNLINRFNSEGNNAPEEATLDELTELKLGQIIQVRERLERISIENQFEPAKNDLISLFERWEYYLSNDKDARDLQDEFRAIADRYPWLNALMWIIILNRL